MGTQEITVRPTNPSLKICPTIGFAELLFQGGKMRFQFARVAVVILAASFVIADDDPDESKAIQKIELLGGKVTRDDTLPERPVVEIDFKGSKRFNAKYLHLLKSFKNLRAIDLWARRLSDDSVPAICELPTLSTLKLGNTGITDVDAKRLCELTNLTHLQIYDNNITDEGLANISDLQNLTLLNLNCTEITDVGLKELGKLQNLTVLAIAKTKITDLGLKELGHLPSLQRLVVYSNQITDDGVKELRQIECLSELDVRFTKITDAGAKELKEALPELKLNR